MKKQTITFLPDIHSEIQIDIQGSEKYFDTETDTVRIYNRKVLLRSAGVNATVAFRKRELFKQLKAKGIKLFAIIDSEF